MKILAAADIHGSQYRLNLILNNIDRHHPDLVILCGDITQFGPAAVATNFLNQIPVKTLAIPGNIDTFDVDAGIIASKAIPLHQQRVNIQGIPFIGVGHELPQGLSDVVINNGKGHKPLGKILDESSVLVTHVPPYKLQDTIFIGSHGGSKELRNIIDQCKPRLVLCGHIHEDPGVTTVGNTTIVNCSLGKRTEGALIELKETLSVSMLD
jgi:Icc-related predicted phosphoesterase